MPESSTIQRHERLIYLPVLGALAAVWFTVGWLTLMERRLTLERLASQLQSVVETIADLNEIAETASGDIVQRARQRREDAFWRALLLHPSAAIWVESDADPASPPVDPATLAASILVQEARDGFTIHAAIPRTAALGSWRRTAVLRGTLLLIATVTVLLATRFLLGALRQRAEAEQAIASASQREAQFAAYREELERIVAERTAELKDSNRRLERELIERESAENELQQHDALLHAVASSASDLLGASSHEEATASVLALIGPTVGVSRVLIRRIEATREGHLQARIRHEWCAPGMNPLIDQPGFRDADLTSSLPRLAAALVSGRLAQYHVSELAAELRQRLEAEGIRSVLQLPIFVEDKLWGSINFIDSGKDPRQWTWAETDTLETLSGLIGTAIMRARYVKELADANMIVQNSPTVLYRVRGEPPFPLIYVSHNISKYGHDPEELMRRPEWSGLLMNREDEERLREAMARTLGKDAKGASIEFRLRAGDGEPRWVENRYTPVRDPHGRLVEIEGMIFDITERKLAEEKIAQLARTDALTGLANRATFIDRIRQSFSATKRGAMPFAILYLDLDHFKPINDTLGHPIGDKLLQAVANRLRECTRDHDVVARLGGDEFAVLQTDMGEPSSAGALAGSIQSTLARTFRIDGNELHITVSIGICPWDDASPDPDTMLSQADLALYRSKEEGRNRYRFHSDDLDNQVLERAALSEDLRQAIERNELELYYQPQVEIRSNRIVGMEAYVRWHHPKRGTLAASAFVPMSEKTGSIIPLGQWVLDNACRQMREWRDQGVNAPVITMNLSLPQLKNSAELIRAVRDALAKWKLDASDLNFDVTEAMLAQLTLMRSDVLGELRRLGVGISIDDFGSEYSSLDYLRTYNVNHLKITSKFMDGATRDPERARTVRAIINFARDLDIGVVTEGVETEEQLDVSSSTSIIAQGFYFSDAIAADEAATLLRQGSIDPGKNEAPRKEAPGKTK